MIRTKKNTTDCNTVGDMPGLLISDWGPAGWNFLHAIAHSQPTRLDDDEQRRMQRFLYDTAHLLPCKKCSSHFHTFLNENMSYATLTSRAEIIRLINDAHNNVNIRHNRRTVNLPEHYRIYSLDRRPNQAPVVILYLIVLGAIIVFRMKKNNVYP